MDRSKRAAGEKMVTSLLTVYVLMIKSAFLCPCLDQIMSPSDSFL